MLTVVIKRVVGIAPIPIVPYVLAKIGEFELAIHFADAPTGGGDVALYTPRFRLAMTAIIIAFTGQFSSF